MQDREKALRCRHFLMLERLSQYTKKLPQLSVGDTVRIQNQTGQNAIKLAVIKVRQNDQYLVRVDGSRRVTLRNRKFLRRFKAVQAHIQPSPYTLPISTAKIDPKPTNYEPEAAEEEEILKTTDENISKTSIHDDHKLEETYQSQPQLSRTEEEAAKSEPAQQLRRSTRERKPPAWQTSGEFI